GHGLGCCPWSRGSGRGVLLSPLPRLPHATAPRLRRHAAIAGFDRYLAAPPVAMPAPGCRGLRPPGCLHQQGPGGLHAPPRVESRPDSPRARDERDELALGRTTSTQGTTTIGLTIRDDAAPPCHIYGQARLAGDGGFHPITAVASAPANASGEPPRPAPAQGQQGRVWAVSPAPRLPRGRARRSWGRRVVCIRPLARHGRRSLLEPGGRERIDVQGFEGDHAKPPVALGGKPRIAAVTQAVSMERGACEPWV